jgi:2-polyprenyl-3-methyl-5-hydroxy-6-metoxy-1,4-benzoquinol methylase
MNTQKSEELFREILAYPIWRQRIPLGKDGLTTMGYLSLPGEWEFNYLPQSLEGKSFLDVGSNDGYFCFEAERRGANFITAADIYHDGGNSNRTGWSVKGVELLKEYLESKVEIKNQSIYDLSSLGRQYDVVWCSNVISWLDNMNEALAQLSNACKDTLYLKDGFLTRYDPEPALQYEKAKNLVNFRANISYIKAVLKSHGFKHIEVKTIYHFEYFDWQTEAFHGVQNSQEVDVFEHPLGGASSSKQVVKGAWVLAEYMDHLFLRNFGWVRKKDVEVAPRFARSWKSKLLRTVLSREQLNDYIRKKGTEPYVKSQMVIAKK